jgi:hypothetical protein
MFHSEFMERNIQNGKKSWSLFSFFFRCFNLFNETNNNNNDNINIGNVRIAYNTCSVYIEFIGYDLLSFRVSQYL